MYEGWGCSVPPKLYCRIGCDKTEDLNHFISCQNLLEKVPKHLKNENFKIEQAFGTIEEQLKLTKLIIHLKEARESN